MAQCTHTMIFESEIVEGLEDFAVREVLNALKNTKITVRRSGLAQFSYDGAPRDLLGLRLSAAVYHLLTFPVPRPKALLGHQYFHQILESIRAVLRLHPSGAFQSLSIDAAGSDSSVMLRIKSELASACGLIVEADKGDLHLRIRRSINAEGWDVLVRISPRPLVTRAWRVCNYEGALNATIAAAMAELSQPASDDVFLNFMCGSGSIIIERLLLRAEGQIYGCDLSDEALACAQTNYTASGLNHPVWWGKADALQLPFPDSTFNKLSADLPFGQLIGSHDQNKLLYAPLLQEAYRVAMPHALFIVITHELRLFEQALSRSRWHIEQSLKINQRGLHPRIFVLRKN